jgi:hypothetical protein
MKATGNLLCAASAMADGPDGTVFGFSKDGVLCVVRGRWDGGDDADSTYVPSEVYQVMVRCVPSE